ncbi:hypothetical protein KCU83_g1632, partial [Aureobasidium melanogenum]
MKRKRGKKDDSGSVKRTKVNSNSINRNPQPTPSILRLYYPQVLTLREYLLEAKTSKNKRRSIASYGHDTAKSFQETDSELAKLLDTILIGCHDVKKEEHDTVDYQNDLSIFSTQASGSTAKSIGSQAHLSFAEIVEFVVWRLFRQHTSGHRPPHVLCHGYYHDGLGDIRTSTKANVEDNCQAAAPDRNEHVDRLKGNAWAGLTRLVGNNGVVTLIQLLQNCGMFMPLEGGRDNFMQISGLDLSELQTVDKNHPTGGPRPDSGAILVASDAMKVDSQSRHDLNTLNTIRFVRHRILYRKPDLNAHGGAYFGLPHIHVLNRIRNYEEVDKNAHLLKYIFPRQFRLHNVFTHAINTKNSAQPFKDYTLREQEIKSAHRSKQRSLPKRLRGECEALVGHLRTRHERCAYSALLQYYCPDSSMQDNNADGGNHNIMRMATSSSQVSAFCRSVIAKVFPGRLWGEEEGGIANKAHVMHQVDRFVRLGRYESLMLHEVAQGIKISNITWLKPPNEPTGSKMSASDFAKRKEIFAELLYYLFDSFLIPLISNNFYVTESSTFRNRLLYFRHDMWQKLSEPALASLRTSMFEEVSQRRVKKTLSNMSIGTGRVRLLPKESGLRPIINLKRRVLSKRNGRLVLGKSVNKILTPAFHVLNLEKSIAPERLGSSMFSSDEIYQRLHRFRNQLQETGKASKPLYFAKVDVQSCFDSIPQKPLLRLLNALISAEGYTITRYAQAKALGDFGSSEDQPTIIPRASWKFKGKARTTDQNEMFSDHAQKEAEAALGTIFVDLEGKTHRSRVGMLALLREHIERNIVQIGKKFYRQTTGIPQGSIVSSLLCNFFYAELEQRVLAFLQDDESLLLRLIDDFLLITANRDNATRFVQVMHRGLPEYGLKVKEDKSKVNFNVQVDGRVVSRLPAATNFPYCGNAINTVNLNITRDETRRQQNNTAAATTVDFSRCPGQNFHRKTFSDNKTMTTHVNTTSIATTTTINTERDHSPGSPPDLTGSKSSKSSGSFRSTCLTSQPSHDNLSHFEDIALADSGRDEADDLHIRITPRKLSNTYAPPPRRTVSAAPHNGRSPSAPEVLRDATNTHRPRYPSLKSHVSAANLNARPIRRGFTSPSTPSLVMGARTRPSRSVSPNGQALSDGGRSPTSAAPKTLAPRPPLRPRKSVKELEAEYHDSDEEVPEDAVIWNVPISPRPPMHSTPSSPTRTVSTKITPELKPVNSNAPSKEEAPRSATRPPMPHSATIAAFPPDPASPRLQRGRTWNEDLSEEAREVAAALEEHAERVSQERRRSTRNSTNGSPPRPSMKLRTKTSVMELPPLQKGNVMIDPLPISKEKEAVLTRTRPSWLPPKSQKEEKKHMKEWERMMAAAEAAERKRIAKEAEKQQQRRHVESNIARIWEQHVIPNWDDVVKEPRTRELWWRGVTPRDRGTVWSKAIGNELSLTETSYANALKRARTLQSSVNSLPEEERSKHADAGWLAAISRDVPTVFPELGIFGPGAPLHSTLEDVLLAYSAYRSDVGYVYGVHTIAGLLVLNMSASAAFIALANMLNRPLALAFLINDQATVSRIYSTVLSTLKYKMPRLHEHLTSPETGCKGPEEWLHPFLATLGTQILSPDSCSRLWDIAVFEGDKTFIRAAVGVLALLESRLYGPREELLSLIGWGARPLDFEEEQVIVAIREAGKISPHNSTPDLNGNKR